MKTQTWVVIGWFLLNIAIFVWGVSRPEPLVQLNCVFSSSPFDRVLDTANCGERR